MFIQFVSESCPEDIYNFQHKIENKTIIHTPLDVFEHLKEFLKDKKQEYFMMISMGASGETIATRIITIGLLNHTLVHPREVFRDAIIDGAARIIVIHNHPSGSLEPSSMDKSLTRQLCESGSILGIEVSDHIIISKDGFISLKSEGLM